MEKAETIEYRKSPRWYIAVFILFIIFILIGAANNDYSIAFLIFIILCSGIPKYISNRIFLSDSSIMFVKDLINTKDIKVPYSKINSVKVDWVWANGGNIVISTDGREYRCKNMNNIEDLQQELNERIENSLVNARSSIVNSDQRVEANAQHSSIDELEKLASLKAQGVLTESEFESEKQKILNH